jgi:predicted protein tyrosine phosphatase
MSAAITLFANIATIRRRLMIYCHIDISRDTADAISADIFAISLPILRRHAGCHY